MITPFEMITGSLILISLFVAIGLSDYLKTKTRKG